MPTLDLNPKEKPIVLDTQTTSWLQVIQQNDKRHRACTIPEQYFEILKNWGLVEGTFSSAKLSANGRARLLADVQKVLAETTKKTRKH